MSEITTSDFDELRSDVNTLKVGMGTVQTDVKDMKDALLGNAFKKKGVIDAVNEHSKKIAALEQKINRFMWLAIGAGAGGGISVFKIIELFISK